MSAPSAASRTSLPRSLLVLYALPLTAYTAMSMPVSMWLMKFSTDTLLIAPAAMGGLFAMARIWDGVSDPMAGFLSDRTRSPVGRRRLWVFASAIPLGLTYVMLWSPPVALEGLAVVLWIGLALLLYETASTAFYIPFSALGLELTQDYHERTRLFGWRQMLSTIGFSAALAILWLIRTARDDRGSVFLIASATSVLVALVIVLCTRRIPEPLAHQGRGGRNLLSAFRDVARNRHALIIFAILGIESFGMGIIAVLGPFVIDDLVGRVDLMEVMLGMWMVPQFIFIPIWLRMSRNFGKKNLLTIGMAVCVGGFIGQFFLTEGDWPLVLACVFVIGIGTSISQVLGPSIQADIIDWDDLETGERKEGAYVAVWNFIRKAGSAAAAAIGGLALSHAGYDPGLEAQSEAVKDAIRITCGLIPALAFIAGIFVFRAFSLGETEHASMRAAIDARDHGE